MKKLTDEMQKVYDFCVQMEESENKMYEIINDYISSESCLYRSVAYCTVKNFIEDNFIFKQ